MLDIIGAGTKRMMVALRDQHSRLKIRNRKYFALWRVGEKVRERHVDPDMTVRDSCVLGCEHSSV
jgi:hypothetical protein